MLRSSSVEAVASTLANMKLSPSISVETVVPSTVSELLCCEADDFLQERQYARACHAMVDAIEEAGDHNANLRRAIALRIWAVLYGTLWNADI